MRTYYYPITPGDVNKYKLDKVTTATHVRISVDSTDSNKSRLVHRNLIPAIERFFLAITEVVQNDAAKFTEYMTELEKQLSIIQKTEAGKRPESRWLDATFAVELMAAVDNTLMVKMQDLNIDRINAKDDFSLFGVDFHFIRSADNLFNARAHDAPARKVAEMYLPDTVFQFLDRV